ncbi:hypothetical protein ACHAW5_009776 [Stephanodiscus triporus]|uniref:Peptide-methionine (S)-S-oxide reductase n=1 Tax=Stephanodiscus triporus TaxID=2934178 RepID=A0ABD3P531_9STRA
MRHPAFLLVLLASPFSAAAHAVRPRNAAAAPSSSSGVGVVVSRESSSRRAFLSKAVVTSSLSVLLLPSGRALALAADEEEEDESVYFGAGCFWHVQHEMIEAEKSILGRGSHQFTSRTGYAGGKKTDGDGRVCYHNFQGVADYGRSLLGLPGGRDHPMFDKVLAAASDRGMTLTDGRGNDPDTLGKRLVYVMDSRVFPFYQAEVCEYIRAHSRDGDTDGINSPLRLTIVLFSSLLYVFFLSFGRKDHQYHNDFLTPAYGKEYNDLVNAALDDGRIKITGCPDRM